LERITERIDAFNRSLERVGDQLDGFRTDLEDREEGLLGLIDAFGARISTSAPVPKGELAALLAAAFNHLSAGLVAWTSAVRRDISGREFINRFERSVIVTVYGKVKSGKSSLGNFIAGVDRANGSGGFTSGPVPRFRVHAAVGGILQEPEELDPRTGFATDVVECTNRIQEFTLGGLSWIDTPGLHSLTPENGELAKEYVANAELVVFLTSSDSPARASEIAELRRLLPMHKPLLVVVSRFDAFEEDLDENGTIISRTVTKPASAREEQKRWVEAQIAKAGLEKLLRDRSYAFVSTRLAKDALASGDAAAFDASGMPDLFHSISKTLTRDALELKMAGPKHRFNGLIDEILHGRPTETGGAGYASLDSIRNSFMAARSAIERAEAKLLSLGDQITRRTITRTLPAIEALMRKAADEPDRPEHGSKELAKSVEAEIGRHLEAVFSAEVTRVLEGMDVAVTEALGTSGLALNVPGIERKYETISVSQSYTGKAAGSILGGIAGGAIGSFFGPIGTAVGSMIGGGLGSAAGARMAGSKRVSVDVGTNVEEVKAALYESLSAGLPTVVSAALTRVDETALEPLRSASTELVVSIERLAGDLQKRRFDV